MIKKINHIGIATQDIKRVSEIFTCLFDFATEDIHTDDAQGIRTVLMKSSDVLIELIEPLHDESTISGFLKKQKEGLHHVSFEVNNLDEILNKLSEKGASLINERPLHLDNYRVVFINPKSTSGILIELLEMLK